MTQYDILHIFQQIFHRYIINSQNINKQFLSLFKFTYIMNKSIYLTLALIVAGTIATTFIQDQNQAPVRTPWAEEWTQKFKTHATLSQTWSNGQFDYSWKDKSMRINFERAVYSPCSHFGGYVSECNLLALNTSLYIYFPTKELCSIQQLVSFPSPKETVKDFRYVNTTIINKTEYYTLVSHSDKKHYLYTITDKKQTTFWEFDFNDFGQDKILTEEYRYDIKSYSQNVDKKVFELPTYCQNLTIGENLTQKQQNLLEKYFNLKQSKSLKFQN